MTLKDILDAIGLKKSNDKYVVEDSFLDAYVDLLEDDGMGCSSVGKIIIKNNHK